MPCPSTPGSNLMGHIAVHRAIAHPTGKGRHLDDLSMNDEGVLMVDVYAGTHSSAGCMRKMCSVVLSRDQARIVCC